MRFDRGERHAFVCAKIEPVTFYLRDTDKFCART
jgi:hypothetical protein